MNQIKDRNVFWGVTYDLDHNAMVIHFNDKEQNINWSTRLPLAPSLKLAKDLTAGVCELYEKLEDNIPVGEDVLMHPPRWKVSIENKMIKLFIENMGPEMEPGKKMTANIDAISAIGIANSIIMHAFNLLHALSIRTKSDADAEFYREVLSSAA